MRKKKEIFVKTNSGRIFVLVQYSGMHSLVLLTDGLHVFFFEKDGNSYLDLDDVISWHEKEAKYIKKKHLKAKCVKYLDFFKKAKENFKNGIYEIEF